MGVGGRWSGGWGWQHGAGAGGGGWKKKERVIFFDTLISSQCDLFQENKHPKGEKVVFWVGDGGNGNDAGRRRLEKEIKQQQGVQGQDSILFTVGEK